MPRNEHQFDKPTEGRIFLEMEGADPTGLTLDVVVSYPYDSYGMNSAKMSGIWHKFHFNLVKFCFFSQAQKRDRAAFRFRCEVRSRYINRYPA